MSTDDRPLAGQLGMVGVPDVPPRVSSPTVAVFLKDKTASWPEEDARPGERQKIAPQVATMTLAEALVKEHPGDEHFAAYAADLLMRLNTAIFDKSRIATALNRRIFTDEKRAELLSYDWTVEMVALVFDVDDPIAHERQTPARVEWRAAERLKLEALLRAHPGAFIYETKGGYRIVYLLAQPFVIASLDDAERWKRHYKLTAASFARRFGIVPDPSCADWTRCYRLPRVVRDGKREARPTIGDPRAIGALVYEPPTEADAATARKLAEENGRWRIDNGASARQSEAARREYDGEHRSAPTGDGLKWDLDGKPVRKAITLIAEHLPATGRHQLALALAGMLRREHATEADAAHILFESFRRGGSKDPKTRSAVAHHTWSLGPDAPMLGYTTVAEILGEDVAKKIGDCFLSAYHDAFLGPSIKREVATPTAASAPPASSAEPSLSLETLRKALDKKQVREILLKARRRKLKTIERFQKKPPTTRKEKLSKAFAEYHAILITRLLDGKFLDDRAGDGKTTGDEPLEAVEAAMELVGQFLPVGTPFYYGVVEVVGNSLAMAAAYSTPESITLVEAAFARGASSRRVFVAKRADEEAKRAAETEANRRRVLEQFNNLSRGR